MKRIYHRYEKWECWRNGFYLPCSGKEKELKRNMIINMFSDYALTEQQMNRVISKWPFSTEHNLTNETMNRIAWLGQAATCIYCGAPQQLTMTTWNELPQEVRHKADSIALEIIKKYELTHD